MAARGGKAGRVPAWCYSEAEKRGEHLPSRRLSRLTRRGAILCACTLTDSDTYTYIHTHTHTESHTVVAQAPTHACPLATPCGPTHSHLRRIPRCARPCADVSSVLFPLWLTYLPTYLLTNLPASLRIQSPRPIDGICLRVC